MKKLQIAIFLVLGSLSFSQIKFEKGYFITNSGEKINCLIKNMDWSNNPIDFQYKLSEDANPITATLENCKEFGIESQSKYVRTTVGIDSSSELNNKLDYNKEPVLEEKKLFLKVLIEGKANLYLYNSGELKRYFYSIDHSKIEQLIYKLYLIDIKTIKKNSKFKQQLWTNLKCESIAMDRFDRVTYDETSLKKIITEYNTCHQVVSTTYKKDVKAKDLIDITLRPRMNFSSYEMQTYSPNETNVDFGQNTNFGFGIEVEYIFPFFKNKWAMGIEPSYSKSNFSKNITIYNVEFPVKYEMVYAIVELPVTLRHYFFLTDKSKLFINASYVYSIKVDTQFKLYRDENVFINSYEIGRLNTLAFGLGYKYNNKFSIEGRFFKTKSVVPEYYGKNQNYANFSLFLGYTVF